MPSKDSIVKVCPPLTPPRFLLFKGPFAWIARCKIDVDQQEIMKYIISCHTIWVWWIHRISTYLLKVEGSKSQNTPQSCQHQPAKQAEGSTRMVMSAERPGTDCGRVLNPKHEDHAHCIPPHTSTQHVVIFWMGPHYSRNGKIIPGMIPIASLAITARN